MKTFFLNKKITGLAVIRTVCLLILTTVMLASSLTAFAVNSCQGGNKSANPQATKTPKDNKKPNGNKTPAATPTPAATLTQSKNTIAQLNTIALVGTTVSEEKALTTAGGLPLYDFDPDTDPTKPVCTKTLMVAPNMPCTAVWLPLLGSKGASLTVDGISCKLKVTQNVNGQQITCNSHLLYTYTKDQILIATGNNAGNGKWHVATPDMLTGQPPATPSEVKTA